MSKPSQWELEIWESHRGVGRTLISRRVFDSEDAARAYKYQSTQENSLPQTPDWFSFCIGPCERKTS